MGRRLRDLPSSLASLAELSPPRKYILMRVIYQPGRQGQNLKYWISRSSGSARGDRISLMDGLPLTVITTLGPLASRCLSRTRGRSRDTGRITRRVYLLNIAIRGHRQSRKNRRIPETWKFVCQRKNDLISASFLLISH